MTFRSFRMISLLLAMVFILGISGCAPQGSNPSDSSTPGSDAAKDTVVIAAGREPPTFDTMNQNWMMTCVSTLLTHNCLVRVGENLQPEPDLAESYEPVSDTEWVFKLRQGVTFHDGTEMDAEDVKATLERAATIAQSQQYVEKYLVLRWSTPIRLRSRQMVPAPAYLQI